MRFVDLFAGIGGFHLAMKTVRGSAATFVGGAENDEVPRRIYERAFGNRVALGSNIRDLVSGTASEWGLPQFDICLAGFPCQPYSNVGKRSGMADPRSWVFFDLVRAIEYYRPRWFVLENVEKIKTMQRGAVLQMLVARLEAAGYLVDTFSLCARDFGLPQQRKRIFFCGHRKGKRPLVSRMRPPRPRDLRSSIYPTTWHLLERLMPPEHEVPMGSRRTIFTRNEKWMGDLDVDRAIARPLCATMGKWHRANQDNYYTEHYVLSRRGERHPSFDFERDRVRRVTPLEALRLQGFPDDFAGHVSETCLSLTGAYRAIGNAVPVPLAAAVIEETIAHG